MRQTFNALLRTATALALCGATGCGSDPIAPATGMATVRFTVTSPLCSPNTFTIDFAAGGSALGTETIKDKGSSKDYTVHAGTQVLSAYIQRWQVSKDTTVTLQEGQTFVRDLDLYCS